MTMFRQCRLQREGSEQTTWLPEVFAVVGRVLKLRKRGGSGCVIGYTEWDNGWKVVSVGEALVDEGDLHENEHKFHRDAKTGGLIDEIAYYWL